MDTSHLTSLLPFTAMGSAANLRALPPPNHGSPAGAVCFLKPILLHSHAPSHTLTHPDTYTHTHSHPACSQSPRGGITDLRISLATGVWGTVCCSESLLWEAPDSPTIRTLYTFTNTSQCIMAMCLPHQTVRSCRTGAVFLFL